MLVKLEDQWHTATSTTNDGNRWFVETACGLKSEWDHVSVDRLPGGEDPHCTEADPQTAKAGKKK